MDSPPSPTAFRARYVFPADAPPIRDGLVVLDGERIGYVGRDPGGRAAIDLGNAAILPGLVNVHTHLEFSELDSPLGWPGNLMSEWIAAVIAWRRNQTPSDPPTADPADAVRRGLTESLAFGATTLGEIATRDWAIDAPGADVSVFRELLGLSAAETKSQMQLAAAHLDVARRQSAWRPGLSPHAPYTVHPELLRGAIRLACQANVPLAMHLAESVEELELLAAGAGPLVQLLKDLEAWDPTAIPRGIRPLDYLEQLCAAPRVLVIHGNYLAGDEMRFLGSCADHMSVVFCPRTHAWFDHGRYPLSELLAAGANVALGTDSRASAPDLCLLSEMRCVSRRYAPVDPAQILRMGTVCGARALGLETLTGSLTVGKRADLAVFSLPEFEAADPYELLFGADTPLVLSISRGQPV